MTKEYEIPTIDKLVKNIRKDDLEVLEKIWKRFRETKKWPEGLRFRKESGYEKVENAIANLEHIFIWHMNKGVPEHYKLTTEGVYAVEEGLSGKHVKLILSYLTYLKEKFNEDVSFQKATSKDIKENLRPKPNDDEMRILEALIDTGNPYLLGKITQLGEWEVDVKPIIEALDRANTPSDYLLEGWNTHIKWLITSHRKDSHTYRTPKILTPFIKIENPLDNTNEDSDFDYRDALKKIKELEPQNATVIKQELNRIEKQLKMKEPDEGEIKIAFKKLKVHSSIAEVTNKLHVYLLDRGIDFDDDI